MWQSIGLTLLVIVATLACVLLFMLCGEWPRGAGGKIPPGPVLSGGAGASGWGFKKQPQHAG